MCSVYFPHVFQVSKLGKKKLSLLAHKCGKFLLPLYANSLSYFPIVSNVLLTNEKHTFVCRNDLFFSRLWVTFSCFFCCKQIFLWKLGIVDIFQLSPEWCFFFIYYIYSCMMIITIQFYRISLPQMFYLSSNSGEFCFGIYVLAKWLNLLRVNAELC